MRTLALVALLLTVSIAEAKPDAAVRRQVRVEVANAVERAGVPGMVAAIADSEGLIGVGAAGVRKAGSRAKFKANDLVHIGSCTKAMTSALLATLVADGTLAWDDTLVGVLPELKDAIDPAYHGATLWQLVTHRAAFPGDVDDWWSYQGEAISERRLSILRDNLSAAPKSKPGEYLYSNLGYMAAGCMAEKKTGEPWETLIKSRLFDPLGMASAGFGPPGDPGKLQQPWGHVRSGAQWDPKQHDNAEALGPAGRVHCSLADWAKFTALQLQNNQSTLLDAAQLERLRTPTEHYAAGWIVTERGWARGVALSHSGSNTMWYATVWVAPKIDRAFLVATNSCDDKSNGVCDAMIAKLIEINRAASE